MDMLQMVSIVFSAIDIVLTTIDIGFMVYDRIRHNTHKKSNRHDQM